MSRFIIRDEYKDKISLLIYYFYFKKIQEFINENFQKGSCNKSLDIENLNKLEIPFYNIENNKKEINIATKLYNLKINLINITNKIIKSRYYIMNTLFFTESKEIESIQIKDIFTLEKGLLESSKVIEDPLGVPLITGAKVYKKIVKQNQSYIENNNVSLFITNRANGSRKFNIKYYNGECNFSNLMSRFIIKDEYKDKINLYFYYFYFKSIKSCIEEHFQKGSCHKSLDIDNFYRLKIPLYSIDDQNKYLENIKDTDNLININYNEINKHEELVNKIINKYIS
jgi:restriction endonuclease S subunit